MTKADMPDEVRRFILTSVPSVPYLEAILLLRSETHASWGVQVVARRLYIGEQQAAGLLMSLTEAGIARSSGPQAFRYQPATAELAEMLDKLARTYAADLLGVTRLVHSRIDKRAQHFADAFRWRKDT